MKRLVDKRLLTYLLWSVATACIVGGVTGAAVWLVYVVGFVW